MAVGAAQALKARALIKTVKLVTFDPSPEVIPLFEDGTIQAIAAQNPYQMGYQGVAMLDTVVKGGKIRLTRRRRRSLSSSSLRKTTSSRMCRSSCKRPVVSDKAAL